MALDQFPHGHEVEVEFNSFELDPNAPLYSGKSIHESLSKKYGMSVEQAKKANEDLGKQASSVGLKFNFEEMKPTNTFDAHRLFQWAKTKGKEYTYTEKVLLAYFSDSKHIGDIETLVQLAVEAGLDKEEAIEVLQNKEAYAQEVRADESKAQRYGVTGVPFFVINQKYAISGAQPLETFRNALQQVWEEENPAPVLKDLSSPSQGAVCTDEGCD